MLQDVAAHTRSSTMHWGPVYALGGMSVHLCLWTSWLEGRGLIKVMDGCMFLGQGSICTLR